MAAFCHACQIDIWPQRQASGMQPQDVFPLLQGETSHHTAWSADLKPDWPEVHWLCPLTGLPRAQASKSTPEICISFCFTGMLLAPINAEEYLGTRLIPATHSNQKLAIFKMRGYEMADLRCWQIDGDFAVKAPNTTQGWINCSWTAGRCDDPEMVPRACGSM